MKIAAAYTTSEPGNFTQNLAMTLEMLMDLSGQGVDFAMFPELNLSGYFAAPEILAAALHVRDEVFQELLAFSAQTEMAFAVGFPGGTLARPFISHFVFWRGRMHAEHRKTHLSPREKLLFAEGNTLTSTAIGSWQMGLQLCFETHFPEISYAQATDGAGLLAMGFASPGETGALKLERLKRYLCARAYDNGCYVLACNQSGFTSNGTVLPGLALVIDPKGKMLAETLEPEKGCCMVGIDEELIARIKQSERAWFNGHKRHQLWKHYYDNSNSVIPKIKIK